ncbi:hypothetical protein RQN30_00720 [Arcanobacterium hippocoleae]
MHDDSVCGLFAVFELFMLCIYLRNKKSTAVISLLICFGANALAFLHAAITHPEVNVFGIVSSILIYIHYILIVIAVILVGAVCCGLSRFGRMRLVQKIIRAVGELGFLPVLPDFSG